jgi:error-prone DNA polymerase
MVFAWSFRMSGYAEIAVTTNYSFLRGASHPRELIETAAKLGPAAIGIADRNTLAGVVRAYAAWQEIKGHRPKLLVGARLVFRDGTPDILTYPTDGAAYSNLCRLLSAGKLRAPKGECYLVLEDLLNWQEGLLLVVLPQNNEAPTLQEGNFWNKGLAEDERRDLIRPLTTFSSGEDALKGRLTSLIVALNAVAPQRVWLGISMPHHGDDQRRLRDWREIARDANVPLLATNDVLYHCTDPRACSA